MQQCYHGYRFHAQDFDRERFIPSIIRSCGDFCWTRLARNLGSQHRAQQLALGSTSKAARAGIHTTAPFSRLDSTFVKCTRRVACRRQPPILTCAVSLSAPCQYVCFIWSPCALRLPQAMGGHDTRFHQRSQQGLPRPVGLRQGCWLRPR